MSLVEDARRLAELATPMWEERFSDSGVCPHCGEYRMHGSDCVMRSLPRIVAALEAADMLVNRSGEDDAAAWASLVAAVEGAEVPA